MEDIKIKDTEKHHNCSQCGAKLTYAPGTTTIQCDYCLHTQAIEIDDESPVELNLKTHLSNLSSQANTTTLSMISCKHCGADQHFDDTVKTEHCVYCHEPLTINDSVEEEWMIPNGIIPFQLDKKKAFNQFTTWVNGLWFAPNKLKKATLSPENFQGIYIPFWTFDAQLYATYTGERGDYYYVTESYNTVVDGKTVTRTRQVQKTRWSYASGDISGFVDDTLVCASKKQVRALPRKIKNWNLQPMVKYDSQFLIGFVTEKYSISLENGHLKAKEEARRIADNWARNDIGGDTQRVHQLNMSLSNETFKHILLPVYISAFRFNNKLYQFYVNGQTGTISGQRPYSFWKIFFAVLAVLIVIGLIIVFSKQ